MDIIDKKCSKSDCTVACKAHKWGLIKSGDKGWFHQKDGTSWCPDHIPEWVSEWRATKA